MSFLARLFGSGNKGRSRQTTLGLERLEGRILLSGGGFGGQQVISTQADEATSVYASDLDGDDDLDVLSASYLDDKVAWYEKRLAPEGGLPFGATSDDPSEFMIGDVWVTVVLLESDGGVDAETEDWTQSEIDQVKAEVAEGMTWWEDTFHSYPAVSPLHDLAFYIDFTYADSPVETGYEPISRPAVNESLWIDDFLDLVGYNSAGSIWTDLNQWNHDQRLAHDTHWAFTAFVVDSSADADGKFTDDYFAYAYLGGPFLMMTYDNDGWGISSMGQVIAHEAGHIFYALDEYPGSGSYNDYSGYYNTQNLNAYDDNPSPGSRVDSLMAEAARQWGAWNAHVTSPSSSYMIGWQDSDSDGIFDVLDVPLTLSGSGAYDSAEGRYEFTGSSSVQTLQNQNPNGYGHDITTNTVDHVQYNLDGTGWVNGNQYGDYVVSVAQNVSVAGGGEHTIEFRTIFDETGITSNVWSDSFFVSAPSVEVVLQASSDSGVSDTDNITNDNTPTYDVTVNVPGTIEIDWDNDETVDVTDVVAVAGTYQYTPDSALDEGVYTVSVTFTDAAAGVATASDPTTIDRTAPDVPGAPDLQSGSDSGVADDDDLTNVVSPAFDVASTDTYFRFYRDGGRISGNYESGTSYTAASEPAGALIYTVSGVDAAGNESVQSAGLDVTIDRTAPDVPGAPDLQPGSDSGVADDDDITNDTTPTFDLSGFGTYWRLKRDAGQVSGDYATAGTYTEAVLSDGDYSYVLYAVDAAGNVSSGSGALDVTIDTAAPSVPGAPDLQPGSDSGVADDDDITSDTTPTFDLSGFGTYWRLKRDAGQVSGDYATAGTYTEAVLSDGDYSYVLYAVDAAGNVSSGSGALDVTIDTAAPSVPGAPDLQPGSDSGVADDDDLTNAVSPVFDVASTDTYFRFYRDGGQMSGNYQSGTSYTADSEPAGGWTYTVSGVDAAGNGSDQSTALDVTIDRTAPDATDAPDLRTGSDTGVSSSDNITSDRTPTLGLSGFGTYWRLERDGGQTGGDYGTATRFKDGPLGYGDYSYVLYAVDAAGNVSAGSGTLDMTVQFAVEHAAVRANDEWTTVKFGEDFADPVLVAGPATSSNSSPGVVRVKRVRPASFKVRFQEWNYLDGTHKAEQIHWMAVERGTWDLGGGKQLVAGTLKTGNTDMSSPTRVGFSSAFSSTPVVLAQVQTCNDSDAVTDRISGVTVSRFKVALQEEEAGGRHRREKVGYVALSRGVSQIGGINCEVGSIAAVTDSSSLVPGTGWRVWVSEEESKDSEIAHTGEKVGYVSFGSAPPMLADMQTTKGNDTADLRCASFLEEGTVSAKHRWQKVKFSKDFIDPVVVAGPATYRGSDPGVVRIKRVTANSFKVRFQEWNYLNGTHRREQIHWMAVERGTWDLGNGNQLVAGTLKTGNTDMSSPTRVGFSSAFSSTPVVLAQVQTCNDSDAVTDRISGVTVSRFKVALQEEEAGGRHRREKVGYVALSRGVSQIGGINCQVGSIARVTHSPSLVPGTAWDIWLSEEKSKDKETNHAAEKVGYISFGGKAGLLADMQTVKRKDTANLRYE